MAQDSTQSRYPIHPPYMAAIRESLTRGDREEISELIRGAKELQAEYGDLDNLIAKLEAATGAAK